MATPEERAAAEAKAQEQAKDRGDEHVPTPDEGEEGEKDEKDKPELSAEDLAAVAAEGQVPYARFKESEKSAREEREARIALETENRMLRERSAPAAKVEEVDLKALRKASKEALLEGDAEKSAELDEQIATEMQRRADATAEAKIEATIDARELRRAAAQVVEDYPWLDSRSPERNQDAIDEALALRDVYIRRGFTGADALLKAVKRTVKIWTGEGKEEGGGDSADELKRRRDAVALSRGAAAARNQPTPPLAGKGQRASGDAPIKDVATLSDKEFKDLPESEKKKLRGD